MGGGPRLAFWPHQGGWPDALSKHPEGFALHGSGPAAVLQSPEGFSDFIAKVEAWQAQGRHVGIVLSYSLAEAWHGLVVPAHYGGFPLALAFPAKPEPAPTLPAASSGPSLAGRMNALWTQGDYRRRFAAARKCIYDGLAYELNVCMPFMAEAPDGFPLLDGRLGSASDAPFAVHFQWPERGLAFDCASPERFLAKRGNMLYSQPMKGTAARNPGNPAADAQIAAHLQANPKERAENVMIVDLTRNDLSRVCLPGTVRVPELFALMPLPNLFQMYTTVQGQVRPGMGLEDIMRAAFPMGSMTGAPKSEAVAQIAAIEGLSRGPYSGAVGYASPDGDFDFAVLIRTLFQSGGKVGYHVGSAITWQATADAEWAECLLKAERLAAAY